MRIAIRDFRILSTLNPLRTAVHTCTCVARLMRFHMRYH
jgi:hypothetical protein